MVNVRVNSVETCNSSCKVNFVVLGWVFSFLWHPGYEVNPCHGSVWESFYSPCHEKQIFIIFKIWEKLISGCNGKNIFPISPWNGKNINLYRKIFPIATRNGFFPKWQVFTSYQGWHGKGKTRYRQEWKCNGQAGKSILVQLMRNGKKNVRVPNHYTPTKHCQMEH